MTYSVHSECEVLYSLFLVKEYISDGNAMVSYFFGSSNLFGAALKAATGWRNEEMLDATKSDLPEYGNNYFIDHGTSVKEKMREEVKKRVFILMLNKCLNDVSRLPIM